MKKPAAARSHDLPPGSELHPNPSWNPNEKHSRRIRIRRPVTTAGGGKRGAGPTTPLLRWKFSSAHADPEAGSTHGSDRATRNVVPVPAVSVRKLAAGIWMGLEPNVYESHCSALHTNTRKYAHTPILFNNQKNLILHKLEASAVLPNPSIEMVTKWDPGFYSHSKHLGDQQLANISVVSSLQSELEEAQSRIAELENERQSAKKKLDHSLRKLMEEKESWQRREHEKIQAVIDSMRDDLHRERKNRKRMEVLNSKLVSELTEAKMSAKRLLQDYEKERKARELMEEVCDELAKEIGEDKAEVEALKVESMRVREEVEEERKMLQMAEVWREERVQMKLVDAKLTLEDEYSQLKKLQMEIDNFLRPQSDSNPDVEEKRQAEFLKETADAVMVHGIKEFSYQPPPASEDIFSIFEELQPKEESNEREIEPCCGCTNKSTNGCLDKHTNGFANGMIDIDGNTEDESDWETVSHAEEQGSCNSLEGSDPSVNRICEESNASVSGTDWDENGDNGKLSNEISEVFSSTTKQSRKKGSSITRLWRSSCPNNDENDKKHLSEATNGRLSNGRSSNATWSPDMKSGDVGLSSPSVGQWSSPDSVSPHVTRATKGCVEWPRGTQKQSLKAKLLEARMVSQKIQLRQALKQKI